MKIMIKNNFWLSWCIKDLWGTKVMYFYVLKLPFLIPQSYFPKQPATSIYSEVRGLLHSYTRNRHLAKTSLEFLIQKSCCSKKNNFKCFTFSHILVFNRTFNWVRFFSFNMIYFQDTIWGQSWNSLIFPYLSYES